MVVMQYYCIINNLINLRKEKNMKKVYVKPEFDIIVLSSESVLDVSANNGNAGWEDELNEVL